jgi:hypothetical protein
MGRLKKTTSLQAKVKVMQNSKKVKNKINENKSFCLKEKNGRKKK